jgi:hypothetical protein
MDDGGGDWGLPQMSDSDVMSLLLSEDADRDQSEPEIASSIGEQMLHMDIPLLPRSVRARIRDVCSRINPSNAILIGGGIGHLSAWLFDLWSDHHENPPENFRIIEPGTRFCVIIDRLIRRYEANEWAQVISMNWQEVFAEAQSSRASNVSIPESALDSVLPMPLDLVLIDLPEEGRVAAAEAAFDLVAPGGLILLLEPTVPTGDVGDFSEGMEKTAAQMKVESFNSWIELIKRVNEGHSVGFTDLSGGTLVALLKKH